MLKYDNTVSSQVDGKPIYGAQVTVYTADTNTPSPATIFADEAGTTPLSQPILTDQLGYFAFYIGDGKYNIRVMTGAVEISRTNITMVDTLQLKQRALIVPVNEDGGTLPPADQRQGKLLGFDSGGNPTMAVPNSFEGPTGPANSTYTTLAGLKAAAVSNASYIFAPPSGSDGGAAAGTFLYQTAGAPYTADGVNVIKLDAVPLSTGALVRQGADGLRYDPAQSVKRRLDLEVFTTDIRFMSDGTMVGGAKLDGNGVGGGSNDGPAIQGLMNWLAEKGGGTLRVPVGTSKITSVVQVPGTVEVDGSGIFSCINNVGCDAFQLMASDEIGPRKIRRVFFRGFGSDDRSGIVVDVDFPSRVMGISIENCYFAFVRYGIKSKGLWHAEITKNCFNQIYTPIYLTGRNVKVDIIGNSGTKGPSASGPGAACGVQVGDDSALRPEDVQIQRNIFVGFQRGIYWRNCLFGAATHNDLDYCTESVIHFVTADGGTDFSRNWGQVDNTTGIVRGIYGEALGVAPGVGTITVTGNRMRATTVPSAPGQLLSFGADYANNQANIVSSANSYEGSFQVGLRADGVKRCVIENEKTDAQVIIFNTRDSTIGNGNYFGGGLTLSGNVGLTFGTIRGLHTTRIVTLVDIPPNQTSYTTTYLALNYPDLPLGGVTIIAQATDYGGTPHEKPISVAPTRTALNFSIPVPLGVTSTYSLTVEIMA